MRPSSRIRSETTLPSVNGRRRRSGVVVLELILCLAILFVFSLAVVQFGLLLSNYEHVEFSSRVGAKSAAELSTGQLASPTVGDSIKDVVDRILSTKGRMSCQVYVEHNAPCDGLVGTTVSSTAVCAGCDPQTYPPLPSVNDVESGSVRVTVCIPADELAPDLLSWLGFSLSGRIVRVSTTYPYEGCPAGPVVIPIANDSFEQPVVGSGLSGPIASWTTFGTGTAEVFRPDPGDNDFAAIPDGFQVARLTPPAGTAVGIRQVVAGSSIVNGQDYRLLVSIGDSTNTNVPTNYTVRLRASGGAILGTQIFNAIPSGDFVQVAVTGTGTGPTSGQNLVVEIEAFNAGGSRVGYVDQVRLLREN